MLGNWLLYDQRLSASNATIRELEERLESKERELTEVLQKSRDDISERDALISSLRENVQIKSIQADITERFWKEECIKVTARYEAEKVILLASAQLREDTVHSQKMEKTEQENEGTQEANNKKMRGSQRRHKKMRRRKKRNNNKMRRRNKRKKDKNGRRS